MRISLLGAAIGFTASLCAGGDLCGISKRGPSVEAAAAFQKIGEAVGFEQGTILLFASTDQKIQDRSGAASDECNTAVGTERWIVYDPDLIKGDSLFFALAHETAHHMNHDLTSGEPPSKQQELDADRLAARYLTRPPLGWTSQKMLQALNTLPLPKEARGGYPTLEERRAQASDGYRYEASLRSPPPTVVTPSNAPPQPSATGACASATTTGWYTSGRIAAGGVLQLTNVSECRLGAAPDDVPLAFKQDIAGMCAVDPLKAGTRLTWNNIGVCGLMRK